MDEINIPQMFHNRIQRYGDRAALKVKREADYQEISWLTFGEKVRQIAAVLLELGIQKGDRVAILSENRPEWAYVDFGALSIGAVTVPIYATNPAAQTMAILQDSKARGIVVSNQEQLEKILGIYQSTSLEWIAVMDGENVHNNRHLNIPVSVFSLSSLIEKGKSALSAKKNQISETAHSLTSDSLATLIYTSGTTGEPKGVMLTHGNFLSNCRATAEVIPINDTDVYLSFLPLSHVFERMAGYYLMIHQGATIAYAENMDSVPQNMLEVHPTVMCGVPRFFEKLHEKIKESVMTSQGLKKIIAQWAFRQGRRNGTLWYLADFLVFRKLKTKLGGRLRFFVSGGAPLSKEIAEFFYSVGIIILEGYGLTETSPVISCNRLEQFRFGTVGQAIPGVEVKIAEDGEILTRGPHIMKGYFGKESATREVLTVDGWLYTGDIGEIDSDGFLRITDRKKDILITSGGKNVAPQKIENLLKLDEYIQEAMVYGDRKKYLTALIVPHIEKIKQYAHGQGITYNSNQELLNHASIKELIRQRIERQSKDLAAYEQIKYVALLDKPLTLEAGELTPTLKLRRKIVTEKYKDLLEKLYEDATIPS